MTPPAKILVVDDEEFNRELPDDLLVPLGYRVSSAPNGSSALEMAAEDPPDVILLDVMIRPWTVSRWPGG